MLNALIITALLVFGIYQTWVNWKESMRRTKESNLR